ncbi:MAG: bifunctional glutamate N-acetyltransferase/amino-acid acetyltransferase ArgJ [Chloroflexi bacterium]|nr:MAG: bifunctional glutamate N-acetyltransferase/amino-acid acetyltransferase ArgJ [Chloroflexota bacterium]
MSSTPAEAERVIAPRGFRAGAARAGVKTGVADRFDVGLIVSDRPCAAAGVFTTNQVIAAPCVLTRKHIESGTLTAIVANSGIANACTGDQGDRNAVAMAVAAANAVGCSPYEIGVASTGVIGWQLPMDRIVPAIAAIRPTETGFPDFSRAIMTTDTKPKQIVAAHTGRDGGTIRAIGTAKGAGMIHPNMATLLCFVVTDAEVPVEELRQITRRAADRSFNAISVDGDTSTNDTLLVLANGASGMRATAEAVRDAESLITRVCELLAREIVADGEGVTKVFEVRVTGAASDDDARKAARTITTSNLVKTAIHGADPNWGRIIAAAGRSGAKVDDRKASIRIGAVDVFTRGAPALFNPDALRAAFSEKEIAIELSLGLGDGAATAWGTDLSAEYVRINADYTT